VKQRSLCVRGKAVEGHRSPKREAFTDGSRTARSVLECASPLALWWVAPRSGATRPRSARPLGVLANVSLPMLAAFAFLVPQGQPEISQLRSGWYVGKIKIRPEGTVEHQTRIPASFQDGQISRTLYQPLRSGLIPGVAPRQNPCPQGTTETVTTNIFHRNQPGAFGEMPHIPPERFSFDDARLGWQFIP